MACPQRHADGRLPTTTQIKEVNTGPDAQTSAATRPPTPPVRKLRTERSETSEYSPEEQAEGDGCDRGGGDVGDGLAAQHDDGAGDGSGGCGGGAFDEGLDLGVVAVPDEPASRHGDAEVDGDEDGGGGDEGAGKAGGEVADEGGGDDDRPGGDQAHRDGVDELAAGQPVVLGDDSLAQERDDGQAAAEDERPGLEEEQAKRDEDPG